MGWGRVFKGLATAGLSEIGEAEHRRKLKKQQEEDKALGGNVQTRMAHAPMDEEARNAGYEAQAGTDRSSYESTLAGGQDALNASITAAMSAAMPDLFRTLQQTKETNISRGMYNGETPTSYEGDVMSAFQKNIANAAGGQAMNLFNTQASGREHLFDVSTGLGERSRDRYLDLVSGGLDRKQAEKNAKAKQKAENIAAVGKFGTDLIGAINPFKKG